jgi:hypothetical protein
MDELDTLLKGLAAKSLQSIYTQLSIITKYIDFSIQNGYSQTGINFGYNFSGGDVLGEYVSKAVEDNKYITYEQFKEIVDFCNNPQDSVIFELLYYGVNGEACEEIINLKETDIQGNTLNLLNKIEKGNVTEVIQRQVMVPDRVIDSIEDAKSQTEYYKENNDLSESNASAAFFRIYPSEFVVKKAGKKDSKANRFSVATRIRRISEWIGYPKLNITNVWVSGMIHYTKQYMKEHNIKKGEDLGRQDYMFINRRFGYGEQYWFTTKTRILKYLNDPRFE